MPDLIKPTQADREAAWPFMARITSQYGDQFYEKSCLDLGWHDDNHYVQAFALRAQQAREQERAEIADFLETDDGRHLTRTLARWIRRGEHLKEQHQ